MTRSPTIGQVKKTFTECMQSFVLKHINDLKELRTSFGFSLDIKDLVMLIEFAEENSKEQLGLLRFQMNAIRSNLVSQDLKQKHPKEQLSFLRFEKKF